MCFHSNNKSKSYVSVAPVFVRRGMFQETLQKLPTFQEKHLAQSSLEIVYCYAESG